MGANIRCIGIAYQLPLLIIIHLDCKSVVSCVVINRIDTMGEDNCINRPYRLPVELSILFLFSCSYVFVVCQKL